MNPRLEMPNHRSRNNVPYNSSNFAPIKALATISKSHNRRSVIQKMIRHIAKRVAAEEGTLSYTVSPQSGYAVNNEVFVLHRT